MSLGSSVIKWTAPCLTNGWFLTTLVNVMLGRPSGANTHVYAQLISLELAIRRTLSAHSRAGWSRKALNRRRSITIFFCLNSEYILEVCRQNKVIIFTKKSHFILILLEIRFETGIEASLEDVITRIIKYYNYIIKQEDPLRSYSLISAIVCLFVLIIVLKFVRNE